MVNPTKPYVVDTGLAAAFSLMREPEIGHLLENCILVELYRRNARVTYLTTESGFEVDFVAQYPDGSVEVIQVSTDLSDPLTRQREYRALSDTGSAWPDARFLIINLGDEETVDLGDLTVIIMPAWKWLLGN
jgi:predicted AAA+ superfamily ATPase